MCCFLCFFQGRHTKTGQLAAIKVMTVTEVGGLLPVSSQVFRAEGWGGGCTNWTHPDSKDVV